METAQSSRLGSQILSTRKRADLTQEALAERAGVSVNTISNLEAGRGHLPRQATLNLLVSALAAALALDSSEQAGLRAEFMAAARATREQRPAMGRPATEPEGTTFPLLPNGALSFLACAFVSDAPRRTDHPEILPRLAALLQRCVPPRGGRLVDPPDSPDGAVAIFPRMGDALVAAGALRQAFSDDAEGTSVPVCLALHTGWAEPDEDGYPGPTRRRAARLARLGFGGQVLLSQPSRDLVWRTLPEGVRLREVGRHSLSVVERPQPIYQLVPVGAPSGFPPLRPPPTPPTNLPLQLTSFIGREREHVAVEGLLARAPLVTLIGAGGCGKTRLALQVAADLLEGYPDGIWLVELAAVGAIASGDTPLVLQAVATALNLREESGRSLMETLIDTLASRRLLLVLDNCEHLVAACAELAAVLLRRCPRLQILATSREHLAIRGETSYRVPSLSLPEPDHHSRTAAPADYEAVRLFVERARAVHPAFTLSAENVGTVVQVCARLAGIPLAIELAAAAVARLPVAAIAARLEQSIGVLTGGPRDVLPRHRTLRAALDWSWTLLSEQEQALLRRLSVFAGGWRLGAAVAVCTGDGIADWAVPDLLDGLANKSLAAPDERDDGGRRGLLETVRQYADERLAEAGEQATTRDRHLDWCVALAGEAEEQLKGPGQGTWLARLDREHDNLRAALGWARARARGTLELRLAGALWRFWLTRGYLSEGRGWLEGALSGGTEAPSSVRANALTGAGVLAGQQGDHGQAAAFFEEALMLRRALGDTRLVANALHNLAQLTKMRQDYGRAVTLHEEALALYRARDDKPGIALSLAGLGNIALRQGDNKRAAVLHEEALTLYRVLGDTQWIAGSLGNLGNVAHNQGDYARATSLHEEALTLQRTLGDKIGITRSLHNLGLAAYARADYGRTTTLLTEALPLCGELGDRELLADGLELAALVASARRHHRKAARLGGIAEGLRQALGIPLTPDLHTSHEQAARLTRAALGEAAFARAWAEGRALSVEQAIALARADSPDG